MSGGPLRSIAVLGSGVAAWSAAAAFAARVPGVAVTVVLDPGYVPMLADMVGDTMPSIADFHADIGVDSDRLVAQTGATFRLGVRCTGFAAAPWWHCFGTHGAALAGAAFHQHFLGARDAAGRFDDYSVATTMAAQCRFAPPSDDPASPLSSFAAGLHLTPTRYAASLRDGAERRGVRTVTGRARAAIDDAGRIAGLAVDGTAVVADLLVDTVGDLAARLDARRDDWCHWLPADRVAVAAAAPDPALPPHGTIAAGPEGWTSSASVRTHTTRVAVTAGVDPALDAVLTRRFAQGRRVAAWVGNVVAIGEAAVALEPLVGISIHLAHAHIDRIIACLPGRDFASVEIDDFNRQTAAEADRLRDFTLLHYATSDRPEARWRDIAASTLPATLHHDLRLFRERGRLPIHDGESFSIDSWLSVLLGQGIVPRRVDAVAAAAPRGEIAAALAGMRRTTAAAAASVPTHRAYLDQLMERRL